MIPISRVWAEFGWVGGRAPLPRGCREHILHIASAVCALPHSWLVLQKGLGDCFPSMQRMQEQNHVTQVTKAHDQHAYGKEAHHTEGFTYGNGCLFLSQAHSQYSCNLQGLTELTSEFSSMLHAHRATAVHSQAVRF
jgi:hypothetical protein